jgi:hypothetical protein
MVISIQEWRDSRSPSKPLSQTGWEVVEMARKDGSISLNPNGFVASVASLFGVPVTGGLADKKLEALRRFSVRAWFWDLIRAKDVRAFIAAGYSRTNILEILSHVGMARGFTPTIQDDSDRPAPRPRPRSSACRCG